MVYYNIYYTFRRYMINVTFAQCKKLHGHFVFTLFSLAFMWKATSRHLWVAKGISILSKVLETTSIFKVELFQTNNLTMTPTGLNLCTYDSSILNISKHFPREASERYFVPASLFRMLDLNIKLNTLPERYQLLVAVYRFYFSVCLGFNHWHK